MLTKSYKAIFVLLGISLLSVLVLQGFWISSFYSQKQEELRRDVHQALSTISDKLTEREQLDVIRQSAVPSVKTRITKNGQSVKIIMSSSERRSPAGDIDLMKELQMDTLFNEGGHVVISDSIVNVENNHKTVVISKSTSAPGKEELDKLLNKMLLEIKTIDVSPIEDIKPDTLKHLIKKELEAAGLFMPFEFLLKKEDKDTDKIIARSEHYTDKDKNYKADLSGKKVFSDHNYLYVQFPGESDFLFSRMKSLLLLSVIFSVIMILVFYITVRSIMRQKKLGDMKNDFINNMTHELKTPIATISLAIDAISNPLVKSDHEKFDQYTAILKEENQKLNNHVEHVLQMARLDKGELQLHKTRIDLNKIIHASIETHKLQLANKRARLDVQLTQTPLVVVADEMHISTVINNLLDNALKYSNGDCLIVIKTILTGNEAQISIRDNGIGIDESLHKKIFEKFYRVHGGNLHDTKGFGLGLSYVRSILEKHGGSIELNSIKDKGSEFIIKLPVHES